MAGSGTRTDCRKKERADLDLKSERPGLAGLILSCRECKARQSMDGVFSVQTWRGLNCRGRRPWLAAANEACDCEPRTLQRGASNLYFPVIESALSIPPWSDSLQEALGVYWNPILSTKRENRATFIRILAEGELEPVLRELGLNAEDLAETDRRPAHPIQRRRHPEYPPGRIPAVGGGHRYGKKRRA